MKKLNQMRMANDQQLKQIHGTDYAYTETVVIYLRGALRKNPYAVEHAISDLLTTLIAVSYTHLTLPTILLV